MKSFPKEANEWLWKAVTLPHEAVSVVVVCFFFGW